jgi:hypothetical protein
MLGLSLRTELEKAVHDRKNSAILLMRRKG